MRRQLRQLASAALAEQLLDATHVTCPECGGSFTIDTRAQRPQTVAPGYFIVGRSQLEARLVTVTVAFCNACEFAIDITQEVRR